MTEWSYENGPFAEVDDPSGSVVDILKTGAPEGPADSTAWTVAHAGKEKGYSDPGNGSHPTAVFGSSKPGARQSSAGGGNRASSVGGDVFPRRGWKRSIENEDDENFAGLRGSVSAEEEADKLSNKEYWRNSDVR